jgi:hypothetical protein
MWFEGVWVEDVERKSLKREEVTEGAWKLLMSILTL